MNLNDFTDEELLAQLEESGLSERKFAKELGVNFNSLHGRLHRAKLRASAEKVEDTTSGNKRSIKILSQRIRTLDELVAAAEIDLDIWEITRHRVNKWEGYRRKEEKDLVFASGKVDGWVKDSGELHIEPLFQVEAQMVKRNPLALEPVVSPVRIEVYPTFVPRANILAQNDIQLALIIPDPHFGFSRKMHTTELTNFHDRRALNIAIQLLSTYEFSKVIFLGDLLDLAEWSDKFVRSPEMYWTTQPALIEAAWYLAQIKSLCSDVTLLEGNHEARMTRLLLKHMNQAYDLKPADGLDGYPIMSIQNLLGTDKIGIDYIGDYPNCEAWINNEILCTHGNRTNSKSGRTVSAIIDEIQHSYIFGHIHRIEMANKTIYGREGPKYITACTTGCTCRIDGVVPGNKKKQNWQQGLGIVQYTDHDHEIVPVSIKDGKAMYNGKVFLGEDYRKQLTIDTEWSF